MRYQNNHAEVVAEGFAQSNAFSIAVSGKAFRGLLDGAYSRKIEAPIRELSTNAFDAHKAAGSIAPFEIHLPTTAQPSFYIRDFGTGMSHHFMMNRFTVMFDSTKDGMNPEDASLITPDDQVGMLGIGRMSLFAYTDSCTVTVWQDGEARHYTVYEGSDGVPVAAHVGTVPSDEPTGVKIEFAARQKDFKEFEAAAIRVFKGFPVIPTGLSAKVVKELRVEAHEVGSFWRSYPKDYLEGSVFWARQGCVLYPVDLAEIDNRAVETTERVWSEKKGQWITKPTRALSDRYQDFANTEATFIIDFPIGTLDFDLGRERLAYNDRTIISLRNRWDDMLADIGKKLEHIFDGAETGWDYMAKGATESLNEMGLLFQRTPQYEKAMERFNALYGLFAPTRSDRGKAYPIFSINKMDEDMGFHTYYARDTKGMFKNKAIPAALDKAIFIIRGEKKANYFSARLRSYMQKNDLRWAFVVRKENMSPKLWKLLGQPPRMNEDDLPKLERAPSSGTREYYGGGGSFDRVKVINDYSDHYSPITDEDNPKGALYAFLNCGEIYTPEGKDLPYMSLRDVANEHHKRKFFTGKSILLMNVRSNEFDKIDEKWPNLPLFYGCNDDLVDKIGKRDLLDMVAIINEKRFANTRYSSALSTWLEFFPRDKTPLNKMTRFYKRAENMEERRKAALTGFLYYGKYHYGQGHETTPFMLKVIERAEALGIEVLPIMRQSNGMCKYERDLLEPKYEKLVAALNYVRFNFGKSVKDHKAIQKMTFTGIRKELKC